MLHSYDTETNCCVLCGVHEGDAKLVDGCHPVVGQHRLAIISLRRELTRRDAKLGEIRRDLIRNERVRDGLLHLQKIEEADFEELKSTFDKLTRE